MKAGGATEEVAMTNIGETQSHSPGSSASSDSRRQDRPVFHNPFMATFHAKEILARLARKEK